MEFPCEFILNSEDYYIVPAWVYFFPFLSHFRDRCPSVKISENIIYSGYTLSLNFCFAHFAQSFRGKDLRQRYIRHPALCSQLVHSVTIYARLDYKPSLNLPCCSPSRFQSAVTLIALPWQISHSCQEDTLWLLMTIREKMGIRQKGSVRGEMRGARGGLGSGSLVKGEKKRRGWMKRGKEGKKDKWGKWGAGGKKRQNANN